MECCARTLMCMHRVKMYTYFLFIYEHHVGDCIEVLDIGLRKVRGVPVVSSLSLSVSRAFSTNKHNKSSTLGQRTKRYCHFSVCVWEGGGRC